MNLSETSADHHGGLKYFLANLTIYLPYVVACSVAAVVGLIGNVFVIVVIVTRERLRNNSAFILILNLALADLVISTFVESSYVLAVFLGGELLQVRFPVLCRIIGSVCWISCMGSLLTLFFISLNRYVFVFHRFKYNTIFSKRNTIFFCILCWFITGTLNTLHFFGPENIIYDRQVLTCMPDRKIKGLLFVVTILLSLLPTIFIALSYTLIFWFLCRIKKNNYKLSNSFYSQANDTLQLTKCLFASFLLFTVCWMPVIFVSALDTDDSFGAPAHLYSVLMAHMNSALNPLFYAFFSSVIRQGFKSILNRITCSRYFHIKRYSIDFQ